MGVRDLLQKAGEAETHNPEVRATVDALTFDWDSNASHKVLSDVMAKQDADMARTITDALALRKSPPTDRATDSDADVRVGRIRLKIPPSDIRVGEIRYNDSVQGIRTTSSTLSKTGRGKIQIELMMDFPSRELINTQLRQIIAQFRAVPFLPIESHYIYNAVKAAAAEVDPKVLAAAKTRIDKAMRDYQLYFDRMISRVINNPAISGALFWNNGAIQGGRLRWWLAGKTPDKIVDVCGKAIRYFDDLWASMKRMEDVTKECSIDLTDGERRLRDLKNRYAGATVTDPAPHSGLTTSSIPEGLTRLKQQDWTMVPSIMSTLMALAKAANEALDRVHKEQLAFSQVGIPEASKRPIIHAVNGVMHIQTVPNEKESLRVRMVMLYLNEEAYVSQVLYRDVLGNPTSDILDCPSLEYYVRSRFLEPATNSKIVGTSEVAHNAGSRYLGTLHGDYSGDFYFQYPTPMFEEVPKDEPSDGMSFDTKYLSSGSTPAMKDKGTKVHPIMAELDTEREGLIPRSASIYLENQVAFQPISGAMYGAAQHIGAANARIDIVFSAVGNNAIEHDKKVAAIQRMNHLTDQVAQTGGARIRRNIRVKVENDVLALVGVRAVQIDEVTTKTVPGEVFSSEIRLSLTEYTIAQSKRERVRLARPDMALSALKATLAFAAKKVNECLTGQLIPHFYRFFRLYKKLTGTHPLSPRAEGIISEDVLATVLFEDATVNAVMATKVRSEREGRITLNKESDAIWGECYELAKEMLTVWTSWRCNGAPTTIKCSFADVTIEATPRRYLGAIMDVLRRPAYSSELDALEDLTDFATQNFVEVRRAIKEDQVDARRICNYPDLNLPTYGEMLLGMMQIFGADIKGVFDQMNTLTPGPRVKELLKRFIPTYRDLGRIPPLSQDEFDPAYRLIDYVDPDFYFFHVRMSPVIDSARSFYKDEAKKLFHPSSNTFSPDSEEQDLRREAEATRLQALRGMSDRVADTFIYPANDQSVVANLDLVPGAKPQMEGWRNSNGAWSLPGTSIPYGNTPDYMYKPMPLYEKLVGKFVHDDPSHLESLRQETLKSLKDDHDRMIRAFPTFHLFFVEQDSEEWGYWDDIYSYNSLITLSLSEHKFEPTLLEFKLMNTTGSLDKMRSRMEDPDKVAQDARWHDPLGRLVDPRKSIGSPEVEPGTGEPREMKRFYLQVGTHIKFCLGYGSNTDDLEVKFTGQIVEIEYGDITRVLCQSYKSQLTTPLSKGASEHGADPYEVVEYVMKKSPTANFGMWSPYEVGLLSGLARDGSLINDDSTERIGWHGFRKKEDENVILKMKSDLDNLKVLPSTEIAQGTFVHPDIKEQLSKALALPDMSITNIYKVFATRLADLKYSRKMANVYLPRHSALGKWLRWCREFIIVGRTGLEVLAELTRYLPGYVCDVRPYDNNATLYFGKPEQRYFYTSERQDEEREWQDLQCKRIVVPFADDIYAFRDMVNWFENSRYYRPSEYSDEAKQYLDTLDSARFWYKAPGHLLTFFSRQVFKPLAMGKGAKVLGERAAWQRMTYYETPDRLRDLQQVESYITERHLEVLARMAFNKFSGDTKAGTMLTSLLGWRDILTQITARTPGTVAHFVRLRNEVFQLSEDQPTWNVAADTNAGVLDKDGAQIDRARYETAVEEILANIGPWKDYLRDFRNYIQHKIAIGEEDLFELMYAAAKEAEVEEYNPRTKRFRDHHYVDSYRDIIKNGILATKGQMANGIRIKHPKDIRANPTWRISDTFMIDQNIDPGERKVRVVQEWNAEDITKLHSCMWANLAECVRPMYRGSLILRGKERIKPYDIVWITDTYENIHGPIEAERVITHFDAQAGYTTTIVPHLLAIPRSASSWMDSVFAGALRVFTQLPITAGKAVQAGAIHHSPSVTARAVTGLVSGVKDYFALREETEAGIWGNLTGKGRYANMRTPVDIMPLMRNKIPWTAGLRGWGDGDWKVRFFKKWCNIKRGWGIEKEVASKVVRDLFRD